MALASFVLAACACAFSFAALVVGVRELRALVRVTPRPLHVPLLVVIPARNEPEIGACLERVLADPHPDLRVVVVDDRSTDDTAARAAAFATRDSRLRVVRIHDDPPPGVFGKPRALQRGVDLSDRTDVIAFVDADVLLAPGALGALVEAKRTTGAAAVSGVPHLALGSVAEQLLVPTLASVVTARFRPSRVHAEMDDEGNPETAFLNGQIIVMDRTALDGVGGWTAVSGTVLEDVALARKLKGNGGKLRLCDLRALASTRMYASLGEIVEGFGKNATALLGAGAGVFGVMSFALACFPWAAVVLLMVARAQGALADDVTTLATWALAAGSVACAVTARHIARQPRWPAFVLPLSYLGAALVLVRASVRHVRGAPLTWKGRRYDGRPHA